MSPNTTTTRRQKHNTCLCDQSLHSVRSRYTYARLFSPVSTGRQRIQQFPAPEDAQDPIPTERNDRQAERLQMEKAKRPAKVFTKRRHTDAQKERKK